MNDWTKPEPAPVSTGSAEVWPLVIETVRAGGSGMPRVPEEFIEACWQRHEMGVVKYAQALEVHNGRNPLNDLRDEALDAVAYSRQQYERTLLHEDWEIHLMAVRFAARVIQRILAVQR